MNTPNPTPNPGPEPEYHEILAARDARIRAETLRWAAAQWDAKAERSAELPSANLGQSWQRYQLTESLTGVAEWCRAEATAIENGANAPAESVAAGSVVSTEGSGHPQPATKLSSPWDEPGEHCATCRCPRLWHMSDGRCAGDFLACTCRDYRPSRPLDTPEGDTTDDH